MWINHHGLFNLVRRVSPGFLYANGFLLLLVSFVPFPTSLLAEYLDGKALNAAAAFYCATFILISVGYNLVRRSMVRGDLLKPEVSAAHVLSTLVAFANGYLGLAMNLSLWVLWAVLGYKPREAE